MHHDDRDVIVVGAGFSGLAMLHHLREIGLSARVLERGSGVGGTWFWNRYPGARCDIESADYCYSFSDDLVREWRWSERYAAQPEILRYLEHVADRFDLRRDIDLNTEVVSAHFDDEAARWTVTTRAGDVHRAQFLVMATGNLSLPKTPDIEGLHSFEGEWLHTGLWPHDPVDLSGRRVAVVGTGSSGIQAIPHLAEEAEHLVVLQRTPNYSMPAVNRPVSDDEWRSSVEGFAERRAVCEGSDAGTPLPPASDRAVDVSPAERHERYEQGWARGGISSLSGAFSDMFSSEESNLYAQEFARAKIRNEVHDPAVAEALCPTHHIGTKRTCVDTRYFDTYNRPNVELVDLRAHPIERITPSGIRVEGREISVDIIVFAVGFDAITGALAEIDIRGRGGVSLSESWVDGPRTLLGLQTAGFPNLFLVTGPGSPSVLSNMVVSIEQHVDWIADCLAHLRAGGHRSIEASRGAQDEWMQHVTELADATLYPQASSWYLGSNVSGKPRVFNVYVAGCGQYRDECDSVVADGYRGFVIDGHGHDETGAKHG